MTGADATVDDGDPDALAGETRSARLAPLHLSCTGGFACDRHLRFYEAVGRNIRHIIARRESRHGIRWNIGHHRVKRLVGSTFETSAAPDRIVMRSRRSALSLHNNANRFGRSRRGFE